MGFVTRFMNADHKYIDQLWSEFLSEKDDAIRVAELFDKFNTHIQKHISLEDNVLFPRFDAFTGLSNEEGPTCIARRDHTSILKLMKKVQDACERHDIKEVQNTGEHLGRVLAAHRQRENNIQYPVLDRFMEEDEWCAILAQVYQTDTAVGTYVETKARE